MHHKSLTHENTILQRKRAAAGCVQGEASPPPWKPELSSRSVCLYNVTVLSAITSMSIAHLATMNTISVS